MADLTVTAGSVVAGSNATIDKRYLAGATITAGQTVYLDTSTNTWLLADCDSSATTAVLAGVALNGAASGQPLHVLTAGQLTAGATVTVGEIYVLSGTAGGIAPEGDLASGDYVSVLGVGISATVIDVKLHVSGVQVP